MMGCEHCSHPLWAGIKCSQCGRWYDECRTCGKRGCEECMTAGLKQAWENYKQALKEYHTCHAECQRPACVAVRNAVRAERERILAILDDMQEMAGNLHNYYGFAANKIREKSNGVL